jgi:hypothetical protein
MLQPFSTPASTPSSSVINGLGGASFASASSSNSAIPGSVSPSAISSSEEYLRSLDWPVAKVLPPWTFQQAKERFEKMKVQVENDPALRATILKDLPKELPQGYYLRIDSSATAPHSPPHLISGGDAQEQSSVTNQAASQHARYWLLPLPILGPDESNTLPASSLLNSTGEILSTLGLLLPILTLPGFQSLHERFLGRVKYLLSRYLDNIGRRIGLAPRGGSIKHALLAINSCLGLKAHLAAMETILVQGGNSFGSVQLNGASEKSSTDSLASSSSSLNPLLSRPGNILPPNSPPRTPNASPPVGSPSALDRLTSLSGAPGLDRLASSPIKRLAPLSNTPLLAATSTSTSGSSTSSPQPRMSPSNSTPLLRLHGPHGSLGSIDAALAGANASLRGQGVTPTTLQFFSELLAKVPFGSGGSHGSTPHTHREKDREANHRNVERPPD